MDGEDGMEEENGMDGKDGMDEEDEVDGKNSKVVRIVRKL